MKENVCIFDLDNTLYDFIEFFGPAFRGMVSAIAKKTNIDKEILIKDASEVLTKNGFLEYPFLIREMKCFEDFEEHNIKDLEKLAASVFGRIRNAKLNLYPQIDKVIDDLYRGGVTIVAVTNAPLFQSYRRLEALNLIKYFSVIVAVDNINIPMYVDIKGVSTEPWLKKNNLQTITFSRADSKPSIMPYKLLINHIGINKNYWVVGDNIGRDLKPANALNCKTIWAEYGCQVNQKNYDTVLELTPLSVKKHEIAESEYNPDFIAKSPNEILKIIPHYKQLSLWD